ncbi:MAG: galactosyldiacylglycerol synthase [Chloroflexales bacterium]|nr:galactosyldiacylglycerol synthase [Chloroflexales bacterium]
MTPRPVDILFAISDTGGGHRSAAVAISAALDQASGGELSWSIEDILRLTDLPGVRGAPDHYDKLSTRWLRLYDLTFQLTNTTRTVDVLSRFVFLTARRNLVRALEQRRPRIVVSTHPLVHRLVVWARRARRMPFRVITCVTDLVSLHASWTYPGVDLALVPTDEAYQTMYRRGMRPSQMQRTGFPVHPKFVAYKATQAESRQALGLDPDRFTVLLTAGGVGSGRLGELVVEIERAFPDQQLLVVTGKNRAIYDALLNRKRGSHSHIYGFVNNMEALMDASDMVVTKAGPGTLMEALVMRKPVAVTEAVGMQEQGNIDFVLNYELGLFGPTNERILGAVRELQDPKRYAATVRHLEGAVPRNGSAQIAQVIMGQLALVDEQAPAGPGRRQGLLGFRRAGRNLIRGRRAR